MKINTEDTIAAISTPLGDGGIGIVRISGRQALKIADKIFVNKKKIKPSRCAPFTMHYGHVVDLKKTVIDEVILAVMRAPHTYTRENIVEINCHGGIIPLRRILDLVLGLEVRLAQPGEFTQRAFLNGRIDLAQAEAVLNIVNAKTDTALNSAMHQLQGMLSHRINALRDSLIEIVAPLEATIDFPEEEINSAARKKYVKALQAVAKQIKTLIDSADKGIMLQNGISVVLAGAPNVGKSSIMNEFVEYERVIVTHISGTTRDVVEEVVNIYGVPVRLADTAGVMKSACVITQKSVDRSLIFLDKADLVLFVLDASRKINESDLRVAKQLKNKNVLIAVNKVDLKQKINIAAVNKLLPKASVIKISALRKSGIEKLKQQIVKLFFQGKVVKNDELLINNLRHKQVLEECYKNIMNAINIGLSNTYDECLVFEIKQVLSHLGEITGDNLSEDILDAIFSRFCIGK
ncbi:MAG: tRNA uridine-5-carboxymethylaminomethyl(34) synthesis GTPase MnmE [PVC group bacterium]|nr:tRNA uridine-5-carboxymethylaminomethyl(34) synthesis GTPase MnmE [PVC group bacterium]